MQLEAKDKNIAIEANSLTKIYRLYRSPKDRLKESLHPGRKRYHREFFALRDVSLKIKKGEVLGIVGQNGSGKSTLLKILSRVLTPSEGNFYVKGKVSSLLELGSGFNPELTGMENIFFYATILGLSEEKIKSKLQDILDFADIGDFVYQPLKTYSSGMRARLAFSVAINVDPDVLILDEVLAVGDELFRRKCYARMETYFKGGKTILFVSHSVSSINQLCTRAILLDKGEMILEGPAKLVTSQYERYLFAKTESRSEVRKEIIMMNKDEKQKEATYEEIEKGKKNRNGSLPKHEEIKPRKENLATQASEINEPKAYFLPGLIPKSTVEYRNEDVDITDVCILTPEEQKVNVLVTGKRYIYSYKVRFNVDSKDLAFGMMFKTEKGLNVGGASTTGYDLILEDVKKGEVIALKWEFTCNLLFGNYFTNAGVASYKTGDRVTLNRIVDAMIFKVLKSENRSLAGFIYLDQKPIIIHC